MKFQDLKQLRSRAVQIRGIFSLYIPVVLIDALSTLIWNTSLVLPNGWLQDPLRPRTLPSESWKTSASLCMSLCW